MWRRGFFLSILQSWRYYLLINLMNLVNLFRESAPRGIVLDRIAAVVRSTMLYIYSLSIVWPC